VTLNDLAKYSTTQSVARSLRQLSYLLTKLATTALLCLNYTARVTALLHLSIFMPPSSLTGISHIVLDLSVRLSVRPFVGLLPILSIRHFENE